MANTSKNTNRSHQSLQSITPSLSIEALEEIIRNCQVNEQRLDELKRHARHERKKAEYLLRETYRTKYERQEEPTIRPSKQQPVKPPVEYFLSFDDDEDRPVRRRRPRVRFNLPRSNRSLSEDDELTALSHRCEDLLVRLHTDFRPSPTNNYHQPFVYQDMKRATKKKYDQLPEVNERLQRDLNNEIKRRNSLRAKIFRLRLRQHVLLHGRADIDESLTMIDT